VATRVYFEEGKVQSSPRDRLARLVPTCEVQGRGARGAARLPRSLRRGSLYAFQARHIRSRRRGSR